jgi:ATP-binding cassette subfamily B protein
MLSIHPRLTAVALVPLPFVSLSVKYFGAAIHRRFDRIQQQLSDISSVTQEALPGFAWCAPTGRRPSRSSAFARENEEYLRRNRKLIACRASTTRAWVCSWGWGAAHAVARRPRGDGRHLDHRELVAFNTYLMMLAWPMIAFGWVTNLFQRGTASWKRMLEVMDAQPAVTDADVPADARAVAAAPLRGDVEFRHVTFAYGDRAVLNDVSFTVPPARRPPLSVPPGPANRRC